MTHPSRHFKVQWMSLARRLTAKPARTNINANDRDYFPGSRFYSALPRGLPTVLTGPHSLLEDFELSTKRFEDQLDDFEFE
jgi:hypothetical protein